MRPTLFILDEDVQALHDLCVECMGRGCTACLPARWLTAFDHVDRTPPLDPDRIHVLDREPVSKASLAAADCAPAVPAWALTTAPIPDREEEAAEVLNILTAARKDLTR